MGGEMIAVAVLWALSIAALTAYAASLLRKCTEGAERLIGEAHQAREDARLALEAALRMQVEASRARADATALYDNAVRHFGMLPKEEEENG